MAYFSLSTSCPAISSECRADVVISDLPPIPPVEAFIVTTYFFNNFSIFLVFMYCHGSTDPFNRVNKNCLVFFSYFGQLSPCTLLKVPLACNNFSRILTPHCIFYSLQIGTHFISHYERRVELVNGITYMIHQCFVK